MQKFVIKHENQTILSWILSKEVIDTVRIAFINIYLITNYYKQLIIIYS